MKDSKISLEAALSVYKNFHSSAEDKISTFRSARNLDIRDQPGIIDTDKLSVLLQTLVSKIQSVCTSSGFDIVLKDKKLVVIPKEHGAEDILALSKGLCELYISLFDVVFEGGIPLPEILSLYFKYKTIEMFTPENCDLSYDLDEAILSLLDNI